MRFNRSNVLVLTALMAAAAIIPSALKGQDPCSLLPETPADVEKVPTGCIGSYWQRVPTKHFGGLREFGATVAVMPLASAAEAQKTIKTMVKGLTPAAYGDIGFEYMEDASTPDHRVPSPEEIRDNAQHGSFADITGESGPKNYAARFTCGRFLIHVFANPSKGPATRQLLAEMDAKVKSMNVCSASAAPARAQPAVIAPPLTPDPAPSVEPENRGSTRYYDGSTAQAILAAKAAGARYLVVVNRYEDKEQNCIVEERAWVGAATANDGGNVGVRVGPTRSVCVRSGVVSAEQVNKSERDLQVARDGLAKALQRKEEITNYMKDPKFKTQGAAQLQKIEEWITYFEKVIAAIQKGLAASVPQ